MKLLIEIPTWLGDAIMATPAIENLLNHYPKASVTILGSFVATSVFKNHPRVNTIVIDETKKKKIVMWHYISYQKRLVSLIYLLAFEVLFLQSYNFV